MSEMTNCPLFDHDCSEPRNPMSRPPLAASDGSALPIRCLMSFMGDVLERHVEERGCEQIAVLHSETRDFPIYRDHVRNTNVCLVQAPVGAPAAAIMADLLISSGVEVLVACGGCGVLTPISSGMILVPTEALRDEGTSFCYCAPTRNIVLDIDAVNEACRILEEQEAPFRTCKTWTTDGFFRETPCLIEKRKSEGCDAVDMECAALAAVSRAYGARFVEILYSGDSLYVPNRHDARDWVTNLDARAVAFKMALAVTTRIDIFDSK
ncbi:nucleoside phosphorylase [Gordonibacter sp. 28C]|uniref:nucleoside phosphorylase n=1 Tax=Gordonibacter sp. 28C TaxID=2078569 RepID=UPI001314F736|nr:nucleoside phosphorylase [Gordonibacter sp. 28C]